MRWHVHCRSADRVLTHPPAATRPHAARPPKEVPTNGRATVLRLTQQATPAGLVDVWEPVGGRGISAGIATSLSLAIDKSPQPSLPFTPLLAYSDAATGGRATVLRWDGYGWVPLGAAGAASSQPASQPAMLSLTVDPASGAPTLACGTCANVLSQFRGGLWTPLGAAANPEVGWATGASNGSVAYMANSAGPSSLATWATQPVAVGGIPAGGSKWAAQARLATCQPGGATSQPTVAMAVVPPRASMPIGAVFLACASSEAGKVIVRRFSPSSGWVQLGLIWIPNTNIGKLALGVMSNGLPIVAVQTRAAPATPSGNYTTSVFYKR